MSSDNSSQKNSANSLAQSLNAQFQLSGPTAITKGSEFTIALIQNTPDLKSLSFDLVHPETLELVKLVNIVPIAKANYEKSTIGTQLNFDNIPKNQGPISLLTFKVSGGETNKNARLEIKNGKIKLHDGKEEKNLSDHVIKDFEIND